MNYNQFFSFSESPFLDVPDPRFFFPSQQHKSFLAELAGYVNARQGVAVVSGDDGVGKTMLVHALVEKLPPSFQPLIITHPAMEPLAISTTIAAALGITLRERNLVRLTPFAEAVQAAAQEGKYLVVIIDDAHVLTDQHLEEIYILSQMEHQGQQLMAVILVGRKGLVPKVSSKANQRLQELVRHNLELTGLTFEETSHYIDHRLKQVGSSFQACFAEGCLGQIFSRTGGIPRRINQVCDQALNRAWQENRPRVSRDLLGGQEPPAPFKPLVPPSKLAAWKSYGILLGGLLVAGLAGYFIYTSYGPAPFKTSPPVVETPASSGKPVLPPAMEKSPPGGSTIPQVQAEDKTAERLPSPQESPLPSSQAPPGAKARELRAAETSRPSPPDEQGGEAETTKPIMHQVAPEDALLKIVASYYPGKREPGYDAVILANPRIIKEDIIYLGQTLIVPEVDKDNIITLDGKKHFGVFKRYYNASQAEKAGTKLKELQLHFVVRETVLPDDVKVYRIFLGGYASKAELQEAMALAEKN